MNRRTFLGGMVCLTAGLTGCTGILSGGTPTGNWKTRNVTVVWGHHGGYSSVSKSRYRIEDGTVTRTVWCHSGAKRVETAPLSTTNYRETQRLVSQVNMDSWQEQYLCEAELCPVDGGLYSLTVTVEGTTYETEYEPFVDIPASVERVHEHAISIKEQVRTAFEPMSCDERNETAQPTTEG